jgi:glycosyltransferase involved in cell wall biosynthesis
MSRALIVTADVIRPQMAGPAMRAWHIAEHLAVDNEVRLVTTSPYCEVESPAFAVYATGPEGLAEAEAWCDVMVLQGYVTLHHPVLARSGKVIVFDVYDPLHLETLALTLGTTSEARDNHVRLSVENLNGQLARADYLICASSRQRDLYIGQLCTLGRVNPLTYDDDPTLANLIGIVPFGLPQEPPEHRRPALRGVVPGIGPDDDILVWAGGVYDWFDPLTLVRAVATVAQSRPSVRLYFMGMRHPNPDVPEMQVARATRELSAELGLTGAHVFFNDGWVPYSDRQDYLLEATLGVSTHYASAETHFSFRTRQLDYLWATLPVVATEGDSFAELICQEGLGLTVPPQDPDALASAVLRLLEDQEQATECRRRAAVVRQRFHWPVVLEPLAAFCREPRRAPDRAGQPFMLWPAPAPAPAPQPQAPAPGPAPDKAPPLSAMELARFHYRQGGLAQVARQAVAKARRAVSGPASPPSGR